MQQRFASHMPLMTATSAFGLSSTKKWEDGGGGHGLVRTEWRPAGRLVFLPLLIFLAP